MTLREALQDIYVRRGRLTPALVVEAASEDTDAGRLLHSRLEWDDGRAAEQHRLAQARELIRSVRVVYRDPDPAKPERSARAFHAIREPNGHAYRPIEDIVHDEFAKRVLIADMEREWRALYRRWKEFPEFVSLVYGDLSEGAA